MIAQTPSGAQIKGLRKKFYLSTRWNLFDDLNFSKNLKRAYHFEVINAKLDLDWDSFFGDGDINQCLHKFYLVLNNIIENDVPNQRCTPSTYPPWYTSELKNMISEKKRFRSKWKAIMAIRLLNNNFSFQIRRRYP